MSAGSPMQSQSPAADVLGSVTPERLDALLAALRQTRDGISRVILGQEEAVEGLLIGLIAGGHILLEGPPGVGKTLLVRTLGTVTGLSFARIQFTPDLMPGDITGSMVLVPDVSGRNRLEFQPGPIFTQLLLADEINRATPRTQSALLEAMQERTISAAGRTMELPEPFFVLATQNPIEMEGTYRLPEAQIDRFLLRLDISFPTEQVLSEVLQETTGSAQRVPEQTLAPADILQLQALVRNVPINEQVRRAIARFALLTQPQSPRKVREVEQYVRFGLSPRGAQAIVLAAKATALMAGRYNVALDDVRKVLGPATRHRVQLNYEGLSDGIRVEDLLTRLLDDSVRELA
ncbi:MAG TPA: MoxR family ATPase [Amaricoccus sp.]|nr:MoxR family ATPase [Amaricoccus sp.]